MFFKNLAFLATILLALVVFGGSAHASEEDDSNLSVQKEFGLRNELFKSKNIE